MSDRFDEQARQTLRAEAFDGIEDYDRELARIVLAAELERAAMDALDLAQELVQHQLGHDSEVKWAIDKTRERLRARSGNDPV